MNESQAAGCTAGACSACGVLVLGSTRRTRGRPVGSRRATNARGREHLLHSNALLSCGPSHSALSHVRPVAPSAVFYSALLDAGPPCRTPPCRTFALLHAALGAYDTLDSAPSLSGSLDSAALLRSDSSHSNLRASSDSLECVPSAPRSKKFRRPDSILPHSDPHSYLLTTTL